MEWVHVHACGATRVQTHTGVFPRGVGDVSTHVCVSVRAPPLRCVHALKHGDVCIYININIYKYIYIYTRAHLRTCWAAPPPPCYFFLGKKLKRFSLSRRGSGGAWGGGRLRALAGRF